MSNSIHPTAIIDSSVVMGSGNVIGAHVVLMGRTVIGDNNWIGVGVVIGAPPEVRDFDHPIPGRPSTDAGVRIGSMNTIREYAQIHSGWRSTTSVGDRTFVMNQSYVAHDCLIHDGVTIASSVLLAGHVEVGRSASIGLGTVVHQRVVIGGLSMIGMGSVVTRTVPSFSKAFGSPARVHGLNLVGLQRHGIDGTVLDVALRSIEMDREEAAAFIAHHKILAPYVAGATNAN